MLRMSIVIVCLHNAVPDMSGLKQPSALLSKFRKTDCKIGRLIARFLSCFCNIHCRSLEIVHCLIVMDVCNKSTDEIFKKSSLTIYISPILIST